MALSLANIRGLLAVAEHLSFRRAAESLQLGQPALSAQIRALEESVGVALVARTTRDVRLTPEGERFVNQMRRLFGEMDTVVQSLRDPGQLIGGRVTFSCIPTVASQLFPQVIAAFQEEHPSVVVEMLDEATTLLERRILSREADFGIGGEPRWRDELEFTHLFSDSFVLLCPHDHRLAGRATVGLAELVEEPLITLTKGSNIRATTEAYFAAKGRSFAPAFTLMQHYTIGPMVEIGLGVALLPVAATFGLREQAGLRVVPLKEKDFVREIGLVKRKGEPLTAAADAFYRTTVQAVEARQPRAQARKLRTRAR